MGRSDIGLWFFIVAMSEIAVFKSVLIAVFKACWKTPERRIVTIIQVFRVKVGVLDWA